MTNGIRSKKTRSTKRKLRGALEMPRRLEKYYQGLIMNEEVEFDFDKILKEFIPVKTTLVIRPVTKYQRWS